MVRSGTSEIGWARRALSAAVLLMTLALASSAKARDDIVINIDPTTAVVLLTVDGFSSHMGLIGGTVSLETDDPYCIASPEHPCSYVINFVRVDLSSFTLPTSIGTFSVTDPFTVVQGPIPVVDIGLGIIVPAGNTSQGGADISGPEIEDGFRTSTHGLPTPLTMNLDVSNQAFSLEGEFVSDLEGHTATATLLSSGSLPFVNLPPVADAGPDLDIICPQDVMLDASASFDPNDSLTLFRWSSGGDVLGSISPEVGSAITVPFGEGTHDVLLEAFDTFGGRGIDSLLVNVTDPDPDFVFVPGPLRTTSCGDLEIGEAIATSPCGPVTLENDAPASFGLGVTHVTWTATSVNGKVSTAVQRVEVILGDDPACCPSGFNVVEGTSNDDTLVGTPGNDCILGKGGQDNINAGSGDDVVSGGDGDDLLNGGPGADRIYAGSGQDQVFGDSGNDYLLGGDGDDECFGGTGDDILVGGQGQDELSGGEGNDTLMGEDGDDLLQGEGGDDHLAGDGLHDTCLGGPGMNTFTSCETRPDAPSAPDACSDGLSNGTESGLDCGGPSCAACGVGLACVDGGDCATNWCSAEGVCETFSVEDGSVLQALFVVTTDWGGGYCVTLEVTNPSFEAVSDWTVTFDTNQSAIYTSWNGVFDASEGVVEVAPGAAWNATVLAGDTDSSLGFCANRNVPGSQALPFIVGASG